jgi:cell division protein FtsZ
MELEQDDFEMGEDGNDYTVPIKVIGVGGGGGNALEYMAQNAISGNVKYLAVNTDVPALRSKDGKLMKRMQIGKKRTKGRGAGGDPEVGCESANEDRQAIETALEGIDMVFISAGMGGGTGTGAAPIIAEIAKSMGILTVGVVTKPFDFERQQRMNTALKGIAEMRKHVDSLIIIPNQKLLEINEKSLNMKAAFEMVNNILYKVVKNISEVLNTTSDINIDFADLTTIMKDSGDAHIAIGVGTGDNKVDDAVQQIINSPLLETSINNAGKMMVHVSMSDDAILSDVDQIVDKLTAVGHPDVFVKPGCNMTNELKDTIIVTVVATSFMDGHGSLKRREQREVRSTSSEPIEKGNTQQLQDAQQSIFDNRTSLNSDGFGGGSSRGEPLDAFITQSLNSGSDDNDPYRDLEKIFGAKS